MGSPHPTWSVAKVRAEVPEGMGQEIGILVGDTLGSCGQGPPGAHLWGRTKRGGAGGGQGPQKEGQEHGRAGTQGRPLWAGLESYSPSPGR